ncbi:hypothetical protein HAX54_052568 [Datura stramonium]|uniref:Uncharacterized protein n=1 Tax=Datura stramonium TaxID=4076 RepID=A0ABS8SZ72_DATST|nr:hypothetical protein [Datura stramonium]
MGFRHESSYVKQDLHSGSAILLQLTILAAVDWSNSVDESDIPNTPKVVISKYFDMEDSIGPGGWTTATGISHYSGTKAAERSSPQQNKRTEKNRAKLEKGKDSTILPNDFCKNSKARGKNANHLFPLSVDMAPR